jgi:hypothetical protein
VRRLDRADQHDLAEVKIKANRALKKMDNETRMEIAQMDVDKKSAVIKTLEFIESMPAETKQDRAKKREWKRIAFKDLTAAKALASASDHWAKFTEDRTPVNAAEWHALGVLFSKKHPGSASFGPLFASAAGGSSSRKGLGDKWKVVNGVRVRIK